MVSPLLLSSKIEKFAVLKNIFFQVLLKLWELFWVHVSCSHHVSSNVSEKISEIFGHVRILLLVCSFFVFLIIKKNFWYKHCEISKNGLN